MAAPMRVIFFSGIFAFLLVFCGLVRPAISQTSQPVLVPTTVDLKDLCSCDLTFNKCDINCCCDNECTANDTKAFSRCDDYYGVDNSQMCVQKKMMFINNGPFVVNDASPDTLFCVYKDNFLQRNEYFEPESVSTAVNFAVYMSQHWASVWNTTSYPYRFNTSTSATYRNGDAVMTYFQSSGAIGLLGLPKSVNSGFCLDGNPAAYLVDQSSSCVRQVAPLATSCQAASELNAESFYKDFAVLMQPGYINESAITTSETKVIVPTLPVRCVDVDNFEADCTPTGSVPTPEFNATSGVCKNALSQVSYELTYDPELQGQITEAKVTFKLREITDADLPIVQKYDVTYIRVGGNVSTPAKSGNPGYLFDRPVLAGKRVEQVIDGATKVAVSMNSDSDTWLTMMTSSISGDCEENQNSRLPIKFGVNVRSGCTVNVDIANLTDSCQLLQDYAKSLLLGQDPPDYVGRYGNTDPLEFGDWVPVLTENEPPAAQGSSSLKGVCFNMVLGMHYQILYAKTGLLSNPQIKIVGVMRRYQKPQVLRFNCMGEYCQPATLALTQKVEISSSVSFIDVSQAAIPAEKERPVLAVRLPYDFFYPFLSGKAASLGSSTVAMVTSAIFAVAMVMK